MPAILPSHARYPYRILRAVFARILRAVYRWL